jgi:hypothetical protein
MNEVVNQDPKFVDSSTGLALDRDASASPFREGEEDVNRGKPSRRSCAPVSHEAGTDDVKNRLVAGSTRGVAEG